MKIILNAEKINTCVNKVNKQFEELTHYAAHANLYMVQHLSNKSDNGEIMDHFYIYKDCIQDSLNSVASYGVTRKNLLKEIEVHGLQHFLWNKCLALLL